MGINRLIRNPSRNQFDAALWFLIRAVATRVILRQTTTCRFDSDAQNSRAQSSAKTIQRSSVVERSAVNRLVVGSNPTAGAIFLLMTYQVYILQNASGRFYVGQTDDLDQRLASHNRTDKTAGKFTRKNGPWSLVWSEPHSTRATARAREREIKAWKSARLIRTRLLGLNE